MGKLIIIKTSLTKPVAFYARWKYVCEHFFTHFAATLKDRARRRDVSLNIFLV